MAQVFKHEAKKRDVQIIYSKIPESDPIADMVAIGVMEVFDELHSLMSKEKGLAGMTENVVFRTEMITSIPARGNPASAMR